jgi:hypothetical protein
MHAHIHTHTHRHTHTHTHTHTQSLALHPTTTNTTSLLAAVDSNQGLLLHRITPPSGGGGPEQEEEGEEQGAGPCSYRPFRPPPGEEDTGEFSGFGWAGLAFDPQTPERLATVRVCCLLCCFFLSFHLIDAAARCMYACPPFRLVIVTSWMLVFVSGVNSIPSHRFIPPLASRVLPAPNTQVRSYGRLLALTDIEASSPSPLRVHRLWQPPAALAYLTTGASERASERKSESEH